MTVATTSTTTTTSSSWGSTAATVMAGIYDGIFAAAGTIPGGKLSLLTANLMLDTAFASISGGFSGNFANSYFSASIASMASLAAVGIAAATRAPAIGVAAVAAGASIITTSLIDYALEHNDIDIGQVTADFWDSLTEFGASRPRNTPARNLPTPMNMRKTL